MLHNSRPTPTVRNNAMKPTRLAAVALLALASLAAAKDVTTLGAVGDGATSNTEALQKAIDDTNAAGGGTLDFPAGRYVTGTLRLRDGVTLRLAKDAVLLGSTDPKDYRNVDPFMAGDGYPLGHALIVAMDARNVGIEGEGAIDGRGKALQDAQPVPMKERTRPFLVRCIRCGNVSVRGVTLRNAGAWCMHFFRSSGVAVERVTIRNTGLFNNDGIDVDSSHDVTIRDCDVESGDDAICMKTTDTAPTYNVTISGCRLKTNCNGIKFGTESIGDYRDVTIRDCQLRDIGMAGIAVYGVDGAHTERITISDVTMNGVSVPISVRLGARLKVFRETTPPTTRRSVGVMRDVTIRNVRADGVKLVGLLVNGIPDHPIERLTIEDVKITVPGGGTEADAAIEVPEKPDAYPEYNMFGRRLPAYGAFIRHVRDLKLTNVTITPAQPDKRPEVKRIDS